MIPDQLREDIADQLEIFTRSLLHDGERLVDNQTKLVGKENLLLWADQIIAVIKGVKMDKTWKAHSKSDFPLSHYLVSDGEAIAQAQVDKVKLCLDSPKMISDKRIEEVVEHAFDEPVNFDHKPTSWELELHVYKKVLEAQLEG